MFGNREPIGIGNPFVGRRVAHRGTLGHTLAHTVAHCDYTLAHCGTHCGTQCARHRASTGKQSKPKTCCCVVLTFGHLQWAGTRRYSGVLLQIYNTLRYIMIQRNVSMHCKNWLVTACWVQIRTYSIFQLQQCSFSKYMVIYLKPDPPLAFSKTGRISETIFSVFLLLRQF